MSSSSVRSSTLSSFSSRYSDFGSIKLSVGSGFSSGICESQVSGHYCQLLDAHRKMSEEKV